MARTPLTEFAATQPVVRSVPWLSTIPEHDEIVAAWKAGVGASAICRWLIEECGYAPSEATRNRVHGYLTTHQGKSK